VNNQVILRVVFFLLFLMGLMSFAKDVHVPHARTVIVFDIFCIVAGTIGLIVLALRGAKKK
jgi:hypothetical protein